MTIQRPPFVIHQFDVLGSTNDYLRSLNDAAEFTVVVAGEQTEGRGRRERTWHSSPGDGLYCSFLLRPAQVSSSLALISLFSAIAVAETLIGIGVAEVDIKWPNDVLIGERKVCGILAEGTSSAASRVVVGIGVNLNHREFPQDLVETATSVFLATGERIEVLLFLDRLLERIAAWHSVWEAGGSVRIVRRWEELSSFAFGKQIRLTTDGEELTGITQGLSVDGGLTLRSGNDKVRVFLAGEVSYLRKEGS